MFEPGKLSHLLSPVNGEGGGVLPDAETAPAVPPFSGRRWHSRNYIDIRPVLWSLRAHPEQWRRGEYYITHTPSEHHFWTANGFWFYGLYDRTSCSCTGLSRGSFSFIQKIQFGLALRAWNRSQRDARKRERDAINAQFAEHFLASGRTP